MTQGYNIGPGDQNRVITSLGNAVTTSKIEMRFDYFIHWATIDYNQICNFLALSVELAQELLVTFKSIGE